MVLFRILLAIACLFQIGEGANSPTIVSKFGAIREGQFKYFYDGMIPKPNSCDHVLFLGVGTAMTINDYDGLAKKLVEAYPLTVIVTDHVPGFFVKSFAGKFSQFYNEMVPNIQSLVPSCADKENPMIFVSGHSVSGQAIINALDTLDPKPVGFVGLDPYKINANRMRITIPALEWGFRKTSCLVRISRAAKLAYKVSEMKKRIFYRVDNVSQRIAHCVFTDNGCMSFVCGRRGNDEWVRDGVTFSIRAFIEAVHQSNFEKKRFELPISIVRGNYDLFTNQDDPYSCITSEL